MRGCLDCCILEEKMKKGVGERVIGATRLVWKGISVGVAGLKSG